MVLVSFPWENIMHTHPMACLGFSWSQYRETMMQFGYTAFEGLSGAETLWVPNLVVMQVTKSRLPGLGFCLVNYEGVLWWGACNTHCAQSSRGQIMLRDGF